MRGEGRSDELALFGAVSVHFVEDFSLWSYGQLGSFYLYLLIE